MQIERLSSRVVSFAFTLFVWGVTQVRALETPPQIQQSPINVQLTVAAWDAFNKGEFDRAITNADRCIDEFKASASREQAELERAKVPLPPKGSVSENEKNAILSRGLLNDVATCFFIKGRSAEKLNQREVARLAYEEAIRYTYARCWNPQSLLFWSPAGASADRLASLKNP